MRNQYFMPNLHSPSIAAIIATRYPEYCIDVSVERHNHALGANIFLVQNARRMTSTHRTSMLPLMLGD